MQDFDKTVPFDPGFSKISFSFIENIEIAKREYEILKTPHQKRFWLMKFEPTIIEFINKSSAFYFGCILWGGFIHYRFKNGPKEISGNNTKNLSEEEKSKIDCAVEAKAILEYINNFNRDCKYFLKRPAKISNFIIEILNNYIEFSQINDNFININSTNDIKTPKIIEYFKNLSQEQLDNLCETIYSAIDTNKIEKLLEIKIN